MSETPPAADNHPETSTNVETSDPYDSAGKEATTALVVDVAPRTQDGTPPVHRPSIVTPTDLSGPSGAGDGNGTISSPVRKKHRSSGRNLDGTFQDQSADAFSVQLADDDVDADEAFGIDYRALEMDSFDEGSLHDHEGAGQGGIEASDELQPDPSPAGDALQLLAASATAKNMLEETAVLTPDEYKEYHHNLSLHVRSKLDQIRRAHENDNLPTVDPDRWNIVLERGNGTFLVDMSILLPTAHLTPVCILLDIHRPR
jgi:hypothetical protein